MPLWILLVTVVFKFGLAVLYLIFDDEGYSLLQTALILVLGGGASVLIFYFFGKLIFLIFSKIFRFKKTQYKTKNKRRLINFKNKLGLALFLFVYPVLLSIPIGSIIASKYYKNNRYILGLLLLSIFVWAFITVLIKWILAWLF